MAISDRWGTVCIARKHLIVWGASDQFRVNKPILESLGCRIEALIDNTPGMRSPVDKIPLYEGADGLDRFLKTFPIQSLGFVVAIGNPFGNMRLKWHALMIEKGIMPISFAEQTSLICKSATYGEGLQVMPRAIVHNDVQIGTQCIINTASLVEHDCILDDGVEIGPGAVLCGRVRVGKNSWVGANATIRPRVTIGDNTIIGAGAVVVTDVPSNVVAVGVPAKVLRENWADI